MLRSPAISPLGLIAAPADRCAFDHALEPNEVK